MSGMLLICSINFLSAQEQSSPLTSYVSSHMARLSGPETYTGTDAVDKPAAKRTVMVAQRKTYFRLGERLLTLNRQVTDESAPYMFVSLNNNATAIADAARRSIYSQGGT